MSDAPARDPVLPAVPPGTTVRPPRAGAASNGPPPEAYTPPAETRDQQIGSNVAVSRGVDSEFRLIGNLTTSVAALTREPTVVLVFYCLFIPNIL